MKEVKLPQPKATVKVLDSKTILMPENWPSDMVDKFKEEIKGVSVYVCTSGTSGNMLTCRTFCTNDSLPIYFVIDVSEVQQGKTIYIAGPISNIPDDNYPAFERAEMLLRSEGFQPVNPHKVFHEADELKNKPGITEAQKQEINKKYWADYLKKDLTEAMECDMVFLLEGWQNSKGAQLEAFVLSKLGKEFLILENDIIIKAEIKAHIIIEINN